MSNEYEGSPEQIRTDNMHQICKQHMYYHVQVKTTDGQQVEGIITDIDKKNVYMMVPQNMVPAQEGEQESPQVTQQQMSQQGQQGGQRNQRQYGRGYYRRFHRQIFPLAALAALSLYPYYYPPYPPYPPYPYPYYPPYPYPYY